MSLPFVDVDNAQVGTLAPMVGDGFFQSNHHRDAQGAPEAASHQKYVKAFAPFVTSEDIRQAAEVSVGNGLQSAKTEKTNNVTANKAEPTEKAAVEVVAVASDAAEELTKGVLELGKQAMDQVRGAMMALEMHNVTKAEMMMAGQSFAHGVNADVAQKPDRAFSLT